MPTKIDITPSWNWAMSLYIALLENPKTKPEGKKVAREELMKVAKILDTHDLVLRKKVKGKYKKAPSETMEEIIKKHKI